MRKGGELIGELKCARSRRRDCKTAVAIVGHVGRHAAAFAASDIAVFPVIEPEAFGRGAVEAQAMGVPVIASRLGGFTETIIEGETGFLVAPGDADALALALEAHDRAGRGGARGNGARAAATRARRFTQRLRCKAPHWRFINELLSKAL